VTALFNNQAFHTPAISLAFADTAIIKTALNKSDFFLNVINHPLPRDAQEILTSEQYQSQAQFQVAQNIMFAMSFLAASFSVLLVRERAIKGKHLQIVCGVRLPVFWTASYIVDFLTYIIPCCAVMICYKAFDEENLAPAAQEGRLFVMFLIHGLAMLPFVYCLSFMFDTPSTAYVRICLYNVILGIGTFLAVVITELPALKVVNISKVLNVVFSAFLPNFCLGRSVYNLYNNHIGNKVCTTDIEIDKFKFPLNTLCDNPKINLDDPNFSFVKMCCKGNLHSLKYFLNYPRLFI
jgi:ATP-binding cassette subfamily A (ABC1) protein 3